MQTIAQTWIDQGKKIGEKRGVKKGEKRGERKATLKALNQILTIRFDVVLEKFDKQFAKLDLKSLEQLNEVALKVNTLADFEKALAEMALKVDPTSPRSDNGEE